MRAFAVLACAGLLLTAGASAQSRRLHATGDPNVASSFVLDFGDFGNTTANITQTYMTVDIDAATGGAALVNYSQKVEPLILPGGFSTGHIRVEIVPGSSSGEYDPVTGVFSTTEFYAIYFEGDLSAFGLQSPVYLPGNSVGVIDFETGKSGTLAMQWDGLGQLDNPFDPQHPITFEYVCSVNAVFGPQTKRSGPGVFVLP